MKTPFNYDNIAKENNFFGRKKELLKLQEIAKYSNNILIYSKRRMGKTTLVKKFLDSSDEYLSIYVDIFDITSKESFAKSLLKSLSNSTKLDLKNAIKKFTNLFKRVRVEPTINSETLEYSIKPIVATLSFEEMIEDFFATLTAIAKEKSVVIAIDEFQQIDTIKDVKIDAILRTYIQNRENITFILLGSKRHTLTELFSYKAPLYELAEHFELQGFEIDELYDYSKTYLNISHENIIYIYEQSDGETKLILHVLHLLFMRQEEITKSSINEIIDDIIASKDTSYRMVYDMLNNNQKIALKVVANYGNGFYAEEVLSTFNINKQSLQSAISALFNKELIDKSGEIYFIPDRTFEMWVKKLI